MLFCVDQPMSRVNASPYHCTAGLSPQQCICSIAQYHNETGEAVATEAQQASSLAPFSEKRHWVAHKP